MNGCSLKGIMSNDKNILYQYFNIGSSAFVSTKKVDNDFNAAHEHDTAYTNDEYYIGGSYSWI